MDALATKKNPKGGNPTPPPKGEGDKVEPFVPGGGGDPPITNTGGDEPSGNAGQDPGAIPIPFPKDPTGEQIEAATSELLS